MNESQYHEQDSQERSPEPATDTAALLSAETIRLGGQTNHGETPTPSFTISFERGNEQSIRRFVDEMNKDEDDTTTDSSLDDDEHERLPMSEGEEDTDMNDENSGSEDEAVDGVNYWTERCSICFDATMDISLELCHDQYCYGCFQRYITESVMGSWGLGVTILKCPVCYERIPKDEWSRLVPKSVVDHYDRFNQPFRSFTRCCPRCEEEIKPCDHSLKVAGFNYRKFIRDLIRSLALECYGEYLIVNTDMSDSDTDSDSDSDSDSDGDYDDDYDDDDDNDPEGKKPSQIYTTMESLLAQLEGENMMPNLLDIYHNTLKTLSALVQESITNNETRMSAILERCLSISSAFMFLDMDPETWKHMQFIHITYFPYATCDRCHLEFCLQCGNKAHGNLTCEEDMARLIASEQSQDQETVSIAKWYLNNSRRCPNCSIMIDRNEGCNRVDCSLCGYCFCWACRRQWSEKCGFYHCQEVEDSSADTISNTEFNNDQKSELGVPDVSSIEARLATNAATMAINIPS